MFEAEARLSARIAHANVVPVLDVVSAEGEILLVMEYVHGESLSKLLAHERAGGKPVPIPVIASVLADDAPRPARRPRGDRGGRHPAADRPPRRLAAERPRRRRRRGARLVDFGIAKAMGQGAITRDGPLRGKIPYMAPEQLQRLATDRRVDVYAAGVILWEALAGKRLFEGPDEATLLGHVLEDVVPPPSRHRAEVSAVLDGIVARAIARDPDRRFPDARAMALELEAAAPAAPASTVASWVQEWCGRGARRTTGPDRRDGARRAERLLTRARGPRHPRPLRVRPSSSRTRRARPAEAGGPPAPRAAAPRRRPVVSSGSEEPEVVAAGAIASLVLGRGSHEGPASAAGGTSAAATSAASSAEAPASADDEAAPSASTAVVTVPARPPPGPTRSMAPRWCKVFDPDKHIYVMRSMRVARCP